MNFADVMDEIGDRLDTIDGLRVYRFPPDNIAPPAVVVDLPESITFDATYGRGSDTMTVPATVLVGRVSDRASRDRLAPYCAGSGASSIKAVLERVAFASHLNVPSTAGAYASTPRTADLDVTDGVQVDLEVTLDDATPTANIIGASRWVDPTGSFQSWICYLRSDGRLGMAWRNSVNGVVSFPAGDLAGLQVGRRTYRFRLVAASGVSTYFRSTTWDGSFTAVGTAADPGFALLTDPDDSVSLAVGKTGAGVADGAHMPFQVHRARVSTLTGTVLAEVDFTVPLDGVTSFPDDSPTPRTWTVHGAAAIEGDDISPYSAFDTPSLRVRAADDPFEVWTYAGVAYLGAAFRIDISGQGAP